MAKKASAASKTGGTKRSSAKKPASGSRDVARVSSSRGGRTDSSSESAADLLVKLMQSPIVADLLAVAATAALAALAEHGFSSRGAPGRGRGSRAVKEAGKAAAAAIGRRIATEVDEIRKASSRSRDTAEA